MDGLRFDAEDDIEDEDGTVEVVLRLFVGEDVLDDSIEVDVEVE